jgi:hypothetical protein|tara:strand:- start:16 stop:546 length:531 start_codon:yes stop_codon:yes gene_type:complete
MSVKETSYIDDINTRLAIQMRKAFFDKLYSDFKETPPKTQHISICIKELVEGLCSLVPSQKEIHDKIKKEIIYDEVNINTMPLIVNGLIKWIQMFQSPVHDNITRTWLDNYKNCKDYADFLRDFFSEYYQHIEVIHKEIWEARKRLVNGESLVPPEHRQIINGTNGIPDNMKSGLN